MCAGTMSVRILGRGQEIPTYIIILLFPIRQACKGLNHLDSLPPISKRTDGQFMCEVKTLLVKTWLKKFTTSSDERGEQKGTLGAHVID